MLKGITNTKTKKKNKFSVFSGDIIFNAQYPELPPDFIFGEDAEFLPEPSELPVSKVSICCSQNEYFNRESCFLSMYEVSFRFFCVFFFPYSSQIFGKAKYSFIHFVLPQAMF